MKSTDGSLEKATKLKKYLGRLTIKKRKKTEITEIWNERGAMINDPTNWKEI